MQRDKFDGEVTRVVLETEADALAASVCLGLFKQALQQGQATFTGSRHARQRKEQAVADLADTCRAAWTGSGNSLGRRLKDWQRPLPEPITIDGVESITLLGVAAQLSVELKERLDQDPSAPPRANVGSDVYKAIDPITERMAAFNSGQMRLMFGHPHPPSNP